MDDKHVVREDWTDDVTRDSVGCVLIEYRPDYSCGRGLDRSAELIQYYNIEMQKSDPKNLLGFTQDLATQEALAQVDVPEASQKQPIILAKRPRPLNKARLAGFDAGSAAKRSMKTDVKVVNAASTIVRPGPAGPPLKSQPGIVGMRNPGADNICFSNCVMQLLNAAPELWKNRRSNSGTVRRFIETMEQM